MLSDEALEKAFRGRGRFRRNIHGSRSTLEDLAKVHPIIHLENFTQKRW